MGRRGKIINITSVHQENPRAGAHAYDASTVGLRNLTRTLALELAPDLINVDNIAPGMSNGCAAVGDRAARTVPCVIMRPVPPSLWMAA